VRELYDDIVEELAAGDGAPLADSTGTGGTPLQGVDAVEAAMRAVIMLRNAAGQPAGRPLTWHGDGIIDAADPDPEIGLHLALFGVEAMLAQLGWAPRPR
jgi:hypothetical protein